MSKGPLDKQDKKAGENGGSLIIAATETNGLEQLSVVSNGGNGSDGTNGVDGTSLIRSQGFTRSVETAVCDEGMHEIYTTFGQQHKV
uniref:Uncharacterized protein n=1 Tax=Acrobeloides nanus TaxID=290746 RepID=A0A914E6X8_9BILA